MKPKKSLGQNFLINRHAALRIASLLELHEGETVVEIGGGRGDLTCHLLDTEADVASVEVDKELAAILSVRFSGSGRFHLVRGDVLQTDPKAILAPGTQAKLVGNIPYNLTTPILEWTIEHRAQFPLVVLLVQKEVGQRLAAKPGGKDYGSLTVFIQLFYEVKRVFVLHPGSFFPKPTIDSAVIQLRRHQESCIDDAEYSDLRRLTSACFRWRRKTLMRILREEYGMEQSEVAELLASMVVDPSTRPEQLAVADFVVLMRKLKCAELESP